jgi:hypothetical protein
MFVAIRPERVKRGVSGWSRFSQGVLAEFAQSGG